MHYFGHIHFLFKLDLEYKYSEIDTIFNLNEFQSAMIFYVTSIYMIKCPKIVGALPSELKLHRNFLGGKSISAAMYYLKSG